MKWKRTLMSVLAIVLMLGLLPVTAFAEAQEVEAGSSLIIYITNDEWQISRESTIDKQIKVTGGKLDIYGKVEVTSGIPLTVNGGEVIIHSGAIISGSRKDVVLQDNGKLTIEEGSYFKNKPDSIIGEDQTYVEDQKDGSAYYKVQKRDEEKEAFDAAVEEALDTLYGAYSGITELDDIVDEYIKKIEDAIYDAKNCNEGTIQKYMGDFYAAIEEKQTELANSFEVQQTKAINELLEYSSDAALSEVVNKGIEAINAIENSEDDDDAAIKEIQTILNAITGENGHISAIQNLEKAKTAAVAALQTAQAGVRNSRYLSGAEGYNIPEYVTAVCGGIEGKTYPVPEDITASADETTITAVTDLQTDCERWIKEAELANAKFHIKNDIEDLAQGDKAQNVAELKTEYEDKVNAVELNSYETVEGAADAVDAVEKLYSEAQAAVQLRMYKNNKIQEIKDYADGKKHKTSDSIKNVVTKYEGEIENAANTSEVDLFVRLAKEYINEEDTKAETLESAKTDAKNTLNGYLETYLGEQSNGEDKFYTAETETEGKERLDADVIKNLSSKVNPIVEKYSASIDGADTVAMVDLYLDNAKAEIEAEADLAIKKHEAVKELDGYKPDEKTVGRKTYKDSIVNATSADGVDSQLKAATDAIDNAIAEAELKAAQEKALADIKQYIDNQLDSFNVDKANLEGKGAAYQRVEDYYTGIINNLTLDALKDFAEKEKTSLDTYILQDVKTDAKAKLGKYIDGEIAAKNHTLVVVADEPSGYDVANKDDILAEYESQINAVTAAGEVTGVRERLEEEILDKYIGCKLTVVADGKTNTTYHTIGQKALVSLPEGAKTEGFSHWTFNGQRFSYDKAINVYIKSNSTYTAVYVGTSSGGGEEEPVQKEDIFNLTLSASEENGSHYIDFRASRAIVSEDKKVLGVGFLYSTLAETFDNAKTELLLDAQDGNPESKTKVYDEEKVSNYFISSSSPNGNWSMRVDMRTVVQKPVYALAYVLYETESGEKEIISVEILGKNWNDLNGDSATASYSAQE